MTNAPSAELETEERAVEQIHRSLLTTLDHCSCANPKLRTEIAIYAAIDVAVDLSIASGFLWSKRPDIIATLRVLADRLEQRQQNEPVPTLVTSNLRNVLRQSQPNGRLDPKAPAASRLQEG
jgi:hypothetical protein